MVWILNVILILIFSLIGTREASLENNNNKNNNNKNNNSNNNNNNNDNYYYYYYYYYYYCYNNKRYQRSKDGAVVRALALTQPWVGCLILGPTLSCGWSLLMVLVVAPRGFSLRFPPSITLQPEDGG